MKTTHSIPLLLASCAALALAGCNAPTRAAEIAAAPSGPQAWIDDPLSGQQLNLSDSPFEVVVHANDPGGLASFELEVNGQPYQSSEAPASGDPYFDHTLFSWSPASPGAYLLSAHAVNQDGEPGLSDVVEVTVVDENITSTPAASPTVTPKATLGACTFTAAVNLFCRTGPGGGYPDTDSFTAGQMAPVVGMSSDGNYWYVLGPLSGRLCTVPMDERFGTTSGDCSQQPAFTPIPLPPTPTPSPTVCPAAIPGC